MARKVFFYSAGEIAPRGSGSAIRQFTNLRAYLDLGFDVEVVQFRNAGAHSGEAADMLCHQTVRRVEVQFSPPGVTVLRRLVLYAGGPRRSVLALLFPVHTFAVAEVARRLASDSHAIHHFEYIDTASAACRFAGINGVWSCHDVFSQRIPLLWRMHDRTMVGARQARYRRARLRRLREAEDWVARHQKLILNIARHEHEEFRHERGYACAELFPMSWPDEVRVVRSRAWFADGKLRLLHLGRVDGFVGFDSLRFLLGEVFPLLAPSQLEKIELRVVGRAGAGDLAKQIRAFAKSYPQVQFLGYLDDLRAAYGESDLQVVGGTRATGLRTRIVESFVYGLPVLSTSEAAKGVDGLSDGYNVVLARDAASFASALTGFLENPECLPVIAERARLHYEMSYSRPVAAARLHEFLGEHMH